FDIAKTSLDDLSVQCTLKASNGSTTRTSTRSSLSDVELGAANPANFQFSDDLPSMRCRAHC
ncbi:hypothetical protein HAX54_047987, partial [Datura stramonium]|nr:hypothetical protein [Datura stramonium]